MKNKYIKNSRISEKVFRKVVRMYCYDQNATMTARLTGLSRNTVNRLFKLFRLRILEISNAETRLSGEVEIDESYFGPRRVRGKRGRGARKKIPVLGLLKRNGKVKVEIVDTARMNELLPIIKGEVTPESIVYTDGFTSYDSLVAYGYKHRRVNHSKNEFARGRSHINGVESFWSYAKRRMSKMNGIKRSEFELHIKESAFRWNYRDKKMYNYLLKNFRSNPL